MFTGKYEGKDLVSIRNIVELILPFVLGMLALAMRLASFRTARFHHTTHALGASNRRVR